MKKSLTSWWIFFEFKTFIKFTILETLQNLNVNKALSFERYLQISYTCQFSTSYNCHTNLMIKIKMPSDIAFIWSIMMLTTIRTAHKRSSLSCQINNRRICQNIDAIFQYLKKDKKKASVRMIPTPVWNGKSVNGHSCLCHFFCTENKLLVGCCSLNVVIIYREAQCVYGNFEFQDSARKKAKNSANSTFYFHRSCMWT